MYESRYEVSVMDSSSVMSRITQSTRMITILLSGLLRQKRLSVLTLITDVLMNLVSELITTAKPD